MSRYETQSPSFVERVISGALFAGAVTVMYAVWSYFNYRYVEFFEHRGIFKYAAAGAFVIGFLVGISRTATIIFGISGPRTRGSQSVGRAAIAVVLIGAFWLALEYL